MSGSGSVVDALGRASAAEKAARRGSGWYGRYLTAFAAGQLVLVPTALLWHGPLAGATFAVAQALLVGALSVYAARQRVVRRGSGVRHLVIVGVWGAVFALSVVLGTTVLTDSPGFAAAAALACAAPAAVGAWLERRSS
ncbi:hypothetical protein [Streptomyces bambusae]|uniref:Integral membrane protein n=1 Tax=Streptomyces bambusae TaxID=1550616 RepID=A0ABS6ZDS6_9ACTN|nr:hypothetical protein [Streptomyces bambusae]MBW5485927.1 hypothetical protein [Streptomyces bambusae]